MHFHLRKACAGALLACAAYAQPAQAAGEIVAPISAVINSGGPGVGPISNTFDQTGLLTTYTPGVTNFNTYIAGNPQHDLGFTTEWFSNFDTSSASVTYNLGSVMGIDALALWNEDGDGIGTLNLFGSPDGVNFGLLGTFNPFDNPINFTYGPQVFTFNRASVQYIRFDMSGCPQDPSDFPACGVGEVAFRTALVPEPSSWALMILGFGAVGFAMRRRRKSVLTEGQPA